MNEQERAIPTERRGRSRGEAGKLCIDAFSDLAWRPYYQHSPKPPCCSKFGEPACIQKVLVSCCECGPGGKTLADEFARLAALIRNALNSPGADQYERVRDLNFELERVVTSIHALLGLSRFLLPSLFPNLQRAASGGPVIIVNASQYNCDALIVFHDRDAVHIPLQITQEGVRDLSKELHTLSVRATKDAVTRDLAFFLRKIWDQIISPIVDRLQTTLSSQSRIWWCPTAEFSMLPLRAAGPFETGQKNLPELYISSYTPTLTALLRARRYDRSNSATEHKRFLAIGQANAADESGLPSEGAELDNIRQLVDGLAIFTRVDGAESCISRVVEELNRSEWVHLVCHGLLDPEQPFESAFALRDGPFTIQRIIGCDLKNPEFAYLSACHTTVGDEESPDEVIHLASAMQFAGFPSVIGTMWAVNDSVTIKVDILKTYGGRVWSSGPYPRSVCTEQGDEICEYIIRSKDTLYPSRCLVLVYPGSLSRFVLLVLAGCNCYPSQICYPVLGGW